ncbi:MAG: hypothetical protein IPP87_18500 [Ideonella sp.]|nr:hypothetical protein [Ideonella sp.]
MGIAVPTMASSIALMGGASEPLPGQRLPGFAPLREVAGDVLDYASNP